MIDLNATWSCNHFSKLAALKEAEFLRLGSIHRNTYLKSPEVLDKNLSFRNNPRVFLAGQVSGVEGYLESAASGLLAGQAAAAVLNSQTFKFPPKETVLGALYRYVTEGPKGAFSPMNANLGLLGLRGDEICGAKLKRLSRSERKKNKCLFSQKVFKEYFGGKSFQISKEVSA